MNCTLQLIRKLAAYSRWNGNISNEEAEHLEALACAIEAGALSREAKEGLFCLVYRLERDQKGFEAFCTKVAP